MATRTWQGGGAPNPGDWGQANNWVENVVPVNGDEVYFDRGAQDVNQGLAQGAVDLDLLYVSNKYSGSIGSSGLGALTLNWIDDFYYEGQGDEAWFDTANATGITKCVVADSGAGANALHLDGNVDDMYLLKGVVTIDTGAVCPFIAVQRVSGATDVSLSISSGVSVTILEQLSGIVVCESNVGVLYQHGGTFTHGAVGDSNTMTSLWQWGGTTNYLSNGTLTNLYGHSGVFDASGSRGPLTITEALLYYGQTANIANGLLNITITTLTLLGGDLIVDPGRVM